MNEQIKSGAYKKKGAAQDSMAVPAEKLEKIQDTEGGAKKKGAATHKDGKEHTAKELKAEGKKLKQEARDKKKADKKASRATKKSKRKSNRSKRLQDKIDLQTLKKSQTDDTVIKGKKSNRITNLEKRKAKADKGTDREVKAGVAKKKGAALISGKPPKPKGQTTPNTNRPAKTPMDKVTDFAKGFVSHLGQSFSNDFNTIKNAVTGSGKHNGAGKIGGFTQNFGPARQNSYAKGAARVAQIMGKGAADVIDGSTHKHPHVTMSQDPVVIGDASKINTTVTSTKNLPLSVHDQKSPYFKRNLGQANKDMRNFENKNMSQVNIDKKKNIITQEKRKRDGMDYQANTGTDNQQTIRRS